MAALNQGMSPFEIFGVHCSEGLGQSRKSGKAQNSTRNADVRGARGLAGAFKLFKAPKSRHEAPSARCRQGCQNLRTLETKSRDTNTRTNPCTSQTVEPPRPRPSARLKPRPSPSSYAPGCGSIAAPVPAITSAFITPTPTPSLLRSKSCTKPPAKSTTFSLQPIGRSESESC